MKNSWWSLQFGIVESSFDFALDRFELVKISAVHFNCFPAYHSLDQIGFDVCFDVLEAGLGTAKSEDSKILGRVAADKGLSAGFGIVEGLDEFIALALQDVAKEFLASHLRGQE